MTGRYGTSLSRCDAKATHSAPLDIQLITGLLNARTQLARKNPTFE